jgi:hypothetical protein
MGGLGSGRRPSFPTTLGDLHAVDIRYLRRHGLLEPGHWGSLRWSRAGRETGSIRFAVCQDTVTLVCWRDPIWYQDRVGWREPAVP